VFNANNLMKRLQLLIYLGFCCIPLLFSQSFDPSTVQFDLLSSENQILQKGLSQNTIYCVMQDRQGYMWFGTWDGLNKYDGYKFTIYNNQNGLSNTTINAILEAKDGRIWVGTEYGLNCLNRETGRISVFLHNPADSASLSDNWINYLYQDRPGRILVCTPTGLNVMDTHTGKVVQYRSSLAGARATPSNNMNFICQDSKSNYWVGSDFGVVSYDPVSGENIRYLNRPGDTASLSSNFVNYIFEDFDHHIWVGTDGGLNLLNDNDGTFKRFIHNPVDPFSISHNHITKIYEDLERNFWVTTDGGGVNMLNKETGEFLRVMNNPRDNKSLGNNRVYDICEDNVGNLWFGTFIGASKIKKYTTDFELYVMDPNNSNSVRDNFIWSFLEVEPDIFWIGTDEGISVYNMVLNEFSRLEDINPSISSLSSSRIRSLLKDHLGNIWIGTFNSGLNYFNPASGSLLNFSPSSQEQNSICDLYIQSLFEDSRKMIWVGTNNGLNIINPKTLSIKTYKHDPRQPTSIPDNVVECIFEDSDSNIWLVTMNGLCEYNQDEDSFTTFRNHVRDDKDYRPEKYFSVFEDSDRNFWIGSRGSGLDKFNKSTHVFNTYTIEDGLPNNVVYGVVEDEQGFLWMSTNWGISRFDKATQTFMNFDVTDGLQSNEFNANAILKSQSGKLFFGGMKGFNAFYPSNIKNNLAIPKIVITAFKKFNQKQPGEILDGDTIELSYNDNFFSFEFAALDYTNPSKNHYAYMLENYNKDWTFVPANRHFADYTKVSPGTYSFRVIGSNNNNVWNEDGVTLTIIISPPWYQTWYFRIGATLLLFFLIWTFIYLRVRQIRKKHKMEKKVLQIEKQLFDIQQKALRLQMNPHFIFNSLNSIQSYVLTKDVDLAVNYLGRFSQLMRLILSNSRESVVSLADELKAVQHYLEIEKLRFEEKFTYNILVDPEIDAEFTGVPPMILQPYIENAIIHGLVHKLTPGQIAIRFQQKGSWLLCSIEDNGVGRSKAAEIKRQSGLNSKSRGMMITKERLEILSKKSDEKFSVKVIDLKDENGEPAGTRVELLIFPQEI